MTASSFAAALAPRILVLILLRDLVEQLAKPAGDLDKRLIL